MKILLTGGAGFIGSHTATTLLAAGHDIVIVDNFLNSNSAIVSQIQKLASKSIATIQLDICNTSALREVLVEHRIDAVVHFAGLKAAGESMNQPLNYYMNNVGGTISLLQAMNEIGTKILVFSSSATVYGNPQYLPINELHPTSPINPYGRTKLQIEHILSDLVASDAEWRIGSLRYFNPVGAHESGMIGEDPRGVPNNLMPFIVKVAAKMLPELSIYGCDYSTHDGTGIRDYVHVMDLAEGHLAALNYLVDHPGGWTFNLGAGKGYSVLDVIKTFEEINEKKINYKIVERRPGDIAASFADTTLAQNVLGWNAKRDLAEMCRSAWRNELLKIK